MAMICNWFCAWSSSRPLGRCCCWSRQARARSWAGIWLRLCRRIVRDYKFRGSDAAFTLKLWPNVRRGEKLYISPYKENADLKFDSSLATEVCVMKPYVVPLLQELPRGQYPDADAILAAYDKIEALDESLIPADSLIREFIGGGSFSY